MLSVMHVLTFLAVLILITMAIFAASYGGLKPDFGGAVPFPGDWSVSWGFIMIIFAMLLSIAAAALKIVASFKTKDTV